MKIDNFFIENDNHTFIIAEISANHNRDFDLTVKTLHAVKDAGANAVKIQTYTPDTITLDCNNEHFKIKQKSLWSGMNLYQLYKKAYMPWDWQPKLKKIADSLGLILFSSPFDKTSVDFLSKMNVPAYKIASFEITDIPLIEYTAKKNKPIIISTGIAYVDEITEAVEACRAVGNDQIILLKCTSAYPAKIEQANILTISDMKHKFKVPIGVSDHTIGNIVPITAVSLGACIVEKHFVLDKTINSLDASFSMTPLEFSEMVTSIREVEKALGKINYELTDELKNERYFSRSLFAVKDIAAGEILTDENIKSIRPGTGLAPKYIKEIIGKKSIKTITRGTPIERKMVE